MDFFSEKLTLQLFSISFAEMHNKFNSQQWPRLGPTLRLKMRMKYISGLFLNLWKIDLKMIIEQHGKKICDQQIFLRKINEK